MTKRIFLVVFSLVAAVLISACGETTPGPASFKLTVNKTGNGTVTSSNGDINCGSDCDQTYTQSTSVTLEAEPDEGATFSGWSGAGCTGTAACIVTVNSAKTVTATFTGGGTGPGPNPGGPFLFQAFVESGQGRLRSDDGKINCTSNPTDDAANCAAEYPNGTQVKLTATPDAGFVLNQFGGSSCTVDASNPNICTYTMSKDRDARVTFGPEGADTFELAADSDDAEQYTSSDGTFTANTVVIDSSDLELNYDEGAKVTQLVGIRFTGVTAAAGKTISEVYIEFTPKARDATIPNLTIQAEASATPATFSAINNNISNRSLTTESVAWSPAAWTVDNVTAATRTPNLLSLMTASGWTSGGDVAFIITGEDTDAQRNAYSRDGNTSKAPKLVVVYQ